MVWNGISDFETESSHLMLCLGFSSFELTNDNLKDW